MKRASWAHDQMNASLHYRIRRILGIDSASVVDSPSGSHDPREARLEKHFAVTAHLVCRIPDTRGVTVFDSKPAMKGRMPLTGRPEWTLQLQLEATGESSTHNSATS